MHRSGRKRKYVEASQDYTEFDELESEIKIEPAEVQFLDDAPISDCFLCKTSSGDKLALFGNETNHDPDIANKIRSCVGLEISSDANPNAHICRGCLQKLDSHYAFQKQALKRNEYAQNQKAEFGTLPEEIRVCRFCISDSKKLLEMFPRGESPECDLLQKIRDCLAIEVNAWDPVTKICRNCIKSIDDLIGFRTRHLPTSVYVKDEIWHYGPSKLAKIIKQENVDASNQESVSDSETSEENEHTDLTCAGRQKQAMMRPELVQLICAEVDGKNFTALSEEDKQMKVIFDDQFFRFHLERENGSSLWTCDNRKLRDCRIRLEIDATGRWATLLAGVSNHTHPPGTAKLMQCPLGKGITEMDGKAEPFYMFNSKKSINRSITNYTRSLIYQGFRYFLQQINVRGVKSSWPCVQRVPGNCKARLTCYGIFHKVEIYGKHNHSKLFERDIQITMRQHGIDTTSSDAISEFQNVNTIEMMTEPLMTPSKRVRVEKKSLVIEKNPEIFGLLKQDDAERNFEVIKIGGKFKVVHDGYEYRYFGQLPDKCTIWKCIMERIHSCKVLVKFTPDGKHLEMYERKHTHVTEMAEIFRYPLGMRMIGEETLWLLNRLSPYNESRYVVYMDYVFYVDHINRNGEVRWSCYKKICGAVLSTKGNFQKVVLIKEHSHEKPPKNTIIKMLNSLTSLETYLA